MNGKLTISRISGSREFMQISIECADSCTEFATIELSFENFAKALTGQSSMRGKLQTRGLDKVGKKMQHKPFEFPFKYNGFGKSRQDAACEEVLKHCPEGWEPDLYFSSQGSFGNGVARTTIRKWE